MTHWHRQKHLYYLLAKAEEWFAFAELRPDEYNKQKALKVSWEWLFEYEFQKDPT